MDNGTKGNDNNNEDNNDNSNYGLEDAFSFDQAESLVTGGSGGTRPGDRLVRLDYGSGRTLNISKRPQHAQRHMLILFSRGKSIMRLQGIRKVGL